MKLFVLIFALSCSLRAAEVALDFEDTNTQGVVDRFVLWRHPLPGVRVQLATTTNINSRELLHTNFNRLVTNIYSVSAVNKLGESESSLFIVLPLLSPSGLTNRYAARTWTIPAGGILQRSRDLENWEEHLRNLGTNPMTVRVRERAEFPKEFYRVSTNSPPTPPLPGGGR